MEFIKLTHENLEKEHICCAISSNKDPQVASKKAWLSERFDEGLVFLKSVERGKCFIEYIPAENSFALLFIASLIAFSIHSSNNFSVSPLFFSYALFL